MYILPFLDGRHHLMPYSVFCTLFFLTWQSSCHSCYLDLDFEWAGSVLSCKQKAAIPFLPSVLSNWLSHLIPHLPWVKSLAILGAFPSHWWVMNSINFQGNIKTPTLFRASPFLELTPRSRGTPCKGVIHFSLHFLLLPTCPRVGRIREVPAWPLELSLGAEAFWAWLFPNAAGLTLGTAFWVLSDHPCPHSTFLPLASALGTEAY